VEHQGGGGRFYLCIGDGGLFEETGLGEKRNLPCIGGFIFYICTTTLCTRAGWGIILLQRHLRTTRQSALHDHLSPLPIYVRRCRCWTNEGNVASHVNDKLALGSASLCRFLHTSTAWDSQWSATTTMRTLNGVVSQQDGRLLGMLFCFMGGKHGFSLQAWLPQKEGKDGRKGWLTLRSHTVDVLPIGRGASHSKSV